MNAKVIVVLVLCSVVLAVASHAENRAFLDFVRKYKKHYTADEMPSKFATFKANLKRIEALNAMKTSAQFGVTKFADLTKEEFKKYYLNGKPFVADPTWPVYPAYPEEEIQALPQTFDWRTKGAVTGVKDQGACGSCWAFSTIGNLEGQHFLAGNKLIGLSEQNLVDCDHHCMEYQGESVCDQGCEGGLMPNAFQYVIGNGGIDTETSYEYTGVDGSCSFSKANIGAQISNWTMVSSNETQMAAFLVKNGPVSVAVDALEWQFYVGGIFDFPYCGTSLDHGVLAVGFDHGENILFEDTPFWWIKNSWGDDWGYSGYIKLERNEGLCGVNTFPCSGLGAK